MLAEINQNSKYCIISLICGILIEKKKVELIETKSRLIVAMDWYGEIGGVDQRVQIRFKMNRLWESNVQHGDVIGFNVPHYFLFSFCLMCSLFPFFFSCLFWINSFLLLLCCAF